MTRSSNPYVRIVAEWARLQQEAKSLPLGAFDPAPRSASGVNAPVLLLFSPHPDDEVIVGGLALRLLLEAHWRIVNVPVTLGSSLARRRDRHAELVGACRYIGFELLEAAPSGLDRVNLRTRSDDPLHWAENVRRIAEIVARHKPHAIMFPHADDWNSTHIGTNQLVIDALSSLGSTHETWLVETEFWRPMQAPNVMVELSVEHLGELVSALTFHVGELRRNPYHASLPGWMVDNVRRGAELVLGQGAAAPPFSFAILYRIERWRGGQRTPLQKHTLSLQDDVAALLE